MGTSKSSLVVYPVTLDFMRPVLFEKRKQLDGGHFETVRWISEFKASLYKVSSSTARAFTQRNPIVKNQRKQTKKYFEVITLKKSFLHYCF